MSDVTLRRRQLLGATGTGAIAMALLSPASGGATEMGPDRRSDEPFVGAYLEVIAVDGFTPFDGVIVLNPGGGVDAISSMYRSDVALGAWRQTGAATFTFKIIDFTFDSSNAFTGYHLITGRMTMDGDQFHGPIVVYQVDPTGNSTLLKSGHETGRRIDPLSPPSKI